MKSQAPQPDHFLVPHPITASYESEYEYEYESEYEYDPHPPAAEAPPPPSALIFPCPLCSVLLLLMGSSTFYF